ncbi:MAG TPA: thioredoxin family protein [Candidatus Binatia bacterium]|nr:thioredoxin family protein [Candidatus Binatia bacterium]
MPIIRDEDAVQLRAHLRERLAGPVTIDYFMPGDSKPFVPGRESGIRDDARELLEEVAGLSEKIALTVHDSPREALLMAGMEVDRAPAIVLAGRAKGRVRYFGIPGGYEFGSFLAGLVDVGNGQTDLSEQTTKALRGLVKDVRIRVFVTPTCPFCPAAASLAQKMAVESQRVTADIVEANEFSDLAERYNVRGVPKVVVNESTGFVGAQPEARFLEYVLRAAA